MSFELELDEALYTLSDIMEWNGTSNDPYVNSVLALCRQWLSGDESFAMQTSGSTGTPKKIKISRAQISASAHKSLSFFNLCPGNTVLCPLSIEVVGGKMMLLRSLIGGLHIHMIRPDRTLAGMHLNRQYDFAPITSLQLYEVLKHDAAKTSTLNKLKHLLIGGGIISPELSNLIHQYLSCRAWHSYGMTETASHIALRSLHPVEEPSYSLMNNIHIDIDERQCLKIKGDVTNQEWVQTNDRIELLDTTHFKFLGRIDFVINSGGIKIQIEQLEQSIAGILQENGMTCSFIIAGIPDEMLSEKVVLILEGTVIPDKQLTHLLEQCKAQLPRHHAPKAVYQGLFEYTGSGKIDRKQTLQTMGLLR